MVGGSQSPVTHVYNGLDLRVEQQRPTETIRYLWDGANVLAEYDQSNALQATYAGTPGQYGDVISQKRSGVSRFYHFDALGSADALTDANQAVTDSYEYLAFGDVFPDKDNLSKNPYQFVGKLGYQTYHIDDTAYPPYFVRARHYEPATGRWLSADPLGFAAGDVNLWRYVDNSTATVTDPTGLLPIECECRSPILSHGGDHYWVTVDCAGLASNCCTRACSKTADNAGSWTGSWAVPGAVDDEPDLFEHCEGNWRSYDFSNCWACCVHENDAGAWLAYGVRRLTESDELIVVPAAARWPKERAFGLKKGFRLDLGSFDDCGRYCKPVARTENVWVTAARHTELESSARIFGRISAFLLIVEGTVDWAAICCCGGICGTSGTK